MHSANRLRGPSAPPAGARPRAGEYARTTLHDVEQALAVIPANDRDLWVLMAYAIRHEFGDDAAAFAVWDEWSQSGASYNARDARDVWRSCTDSRATIASLFYHARANGYRPSGAPARLTQARTPAQPTLELRRKPWDNFLQAAWDGAIALHGTVGQRYLTARGCAIPPADGDVRFCPAAWHWQEKRKFPALLSRVTHAETAAPMTLHYTYLRDDGSGKADVTAPHNAKLLAGGYAKAGGVIRLWPDDAVETRLTIAEGIETALTAAHARPPAWACVDASNLSAFPVLAGVESLLIVADHDDKGVSAAKRCAERWDAAGRDVLFYKPEQRGCDMNDEVHQ